MSRHEHGLHLHVGTIAIVRAISGLRAISMVRAIAILSTVDSVRTGASLMDVVSMGDSATVVSASISASRRQTEMGRSICTNIVLVGTELATLGGDTLQFLLGRSVGVADLHLETLVADSNTCKVQNDLITDCTGLETIQQVSIRM